MFHLHQSAFARLLHIISECLNRWRWCGASLWLDFRPGMSCSCSTLEFITSSDLNVVLLINCRCHSISQFWRLVQIDPQNRPFSPTKHLLGGDLQHNFCAKTRIFGRGLSVIVNFTTAFEMTRIWVKPAKLNFLIYRILTRRKITRFIIIKIIIR